eukprot:6291674-Prymnesium_polylepis.1
MRAGHSKQESVPPEFGAQIDVSVRVEQCFHRVNVAARGRHHQGRDAVCCDGIDRGGAGVASKLMLPHRSGSIAVLSAGADSEHQSRHT